MCFIADDFLPDVGESCIILDLGKTSELGLGLDVWPCCFPDECLRKRWCPKTGRFAWIYSTWTKMRGICLIIFSPLCEKKKVTRGCMTLGMQQTFQGVASTRTTLWSLSELIVRPESKVPNRSLIRPQAAGPSRDVVPWSTSQRMVKCNGALKRDLGSRWRCLDFSSAGGVMGCKTCDGTPVVLLWLPQSQGFIDVLIYRLFYTSSFTYLYMGP